MPAQAGIQYPVRLLIDPRIIQPINACVYGVPASAGPTDAESVCLVEMCGLFPVTLLVTDC